MICPNCKKQIPDGSAFCGYCGREIPKVPLCTHCGAELRPNDRFCGVCGAPVEAPADTNKAELTALEQQLAQRREAMASLRRELEEQTEALKAARETLEAERAEQARLAEEKRKAEEARIAEEKRKAEEARLAEEKRKAEEARLAEEKRKAEEARLAKEKRKAEEARLAEEKRKAEEARLAEEKRKAEEAACAQAEAEAKAKEEAEARAAVEKQPEQTEAEPEKPVKKTGGKKTGWLIAVALVLALAAAALAVWLLRQPAVLPDTDEENPVNEPQALPTLADTVVPGGTVTFGRYEQDNDTANGAEPIQWRVLDVQDGKALIISEKILARGLHRSTVWDGHDYTTWGASLIRSWMNDDFYDVAFSDTEKKAIQLTDVKDEANPYMDDIVTRPNTYNWSAMEPGADTQDYVFALSINEFEKYFPDPGSAKAEATEVAKVGNPYAKDERLREALYTGADRALELGFDEITVDGVTWSWWLRTVGPKHLAPGNFFSIVLGDGSLLEEGTCADSCDIGIRPAMWVDASALVATITPGGTVTFGSYEQDNDTANGAEPIQWKVLACEGDTALLISERVLDYLPYDTNGSARWDTSSLRTELNGTFYDSAFSDEEKAVMTTSSAEPYDNPVTGVQDDSAATEDMVFIPSLKQANDYFQDALARVTWGTAYAVAHAREQASALGETLAEDFGGNASCGTSWLLRTPSQNDDTVVFVHDEACDPENSNTCYHRGEEDWGYACSLNYCFWGKNVSSFQVGVRPCIRVRIPAADTTDTMGDLSSVKVGDFITVGRYEQDNNLTNGPEPIEWRVLDKKDGKLLVISDKSLYESSFAYLGWQPVPQNWESSCARGWLNNYFMQTAFTPAEQARVVLTNVHTEPTEGSPIDPGPDTQDYMFLVSGQEASTYFPTAESRRTKTTAYALSRRSESIAHHGFDGDFEVWADVSFWLLRSPAQKPNWVYGAAYIYDYTTPYGEPGDVWYHDGRATGDIRPAMWIEASPAENTPADPSTLPDAVVPGDTITFGHYEQDNDTSNGPEAITWKVLDVQDGKALVISEKILARVRHRYVEDGHGAVTWETSRVRQWLSEDFFDAAFSDEEKTAVCLTNVKSEPNPDYTDTDPGSDTQDYVFVLGLEQYDAYFADDGDLSDAVAPYTEVARVGNPYAKDALVRNAKYYPMNNAVRGNADGSAGWWWLRTVGQDYAADGNFMMRIDATGKADGVGSDADCGVRPAMWVDVDTLTNVTDAC